LLFEGCPDGFGLDGYEVGALNLACDGVVFGVFLDYAAAFCPCDFAELVGASVFDAKIFGDLNCFGVHLVRLRL
jgi:hypothetical protein